MSAADRVHRFLQRLAPRAAGALRIEHDVTSLDDAITLAARIGSLSQFAASAAARTAPSAPARSGDAMDLSHVALCGIEGLEWPTTGEDPEEGATPARRQRAATSYAAPSCTRFFSSSTSSCSPPCSSSAAATRASPGQRGRRWQHEGAWPFRRAGAPALHRRAVLRVRRVRPSQGGLPRGEAEKLDGPARRLPKSMLLRVANGPQAGLQPASHSRRHCASVVLTNPPSPVSAQIGSTPPAAAPPPGVNGSAVAHSAVTTSAPVRASVACSAPAATPSLAAAPATTDAAAAVRHRRHADYGSRLQARGLRRRAPLHRAGGQRRVGPGLHQPRVRRSMRPRAVTVAEHGAARRRHRRGCRWPGVCRLHARRVEGPADPLPLRLHRHAAGELRRHPRRRLAGRPRYPRRLAPAHARVPRAGQGQPPHPPARSDRGRGAARQLASISYKGLRKSARRGELLEAYVALIRPGDRPDGKGHDDPDVAGLLKEFADVFPDKLPDELPPARGVEHAIELKPGARPPPARPLRHQSAKDSAVIEEYVKKGLAAGQLRVSQLAVRRDGADRQEEGRHAARVCRLPRAERGDGQEQVPAAADGRAVRPRAGRALLHQDRPAHGFHQIAHPAERTARRRPSARASATSSTPCCRWACATRRAPSCS